MGSCCFNPRVSPKIALYLRPKINFALNLLSSRVTFHTILFPSNFSNLSNLSAIKSQVTKTFIMSNKRSSASYQREIDELRNALNTRELELHGLQLQHFGSTEELNKLFAKKKKRKTAPQTTRDTRTYVVPRRFNLMLLLKLITMFVFDSGRSCKFYMIRTCFVDMQACEEGNSWSRR